MSDDATINRAARVLRRCHDLLPADRALREELSQHRRLSPNEKRAMAQAVFAYHRWIQWTDPRDSVQARLATTQRLQTRFDTNPANIKPQALAARAVPDWLATEVELGTDDLRALQSPPPVWIRARTGHLDSLRTALKDLENAPRPGEPTAQRYTGTRDLFRTEGFQQGQFEIQDLGSQLVGTACAAQPGEIWWDTCAGEGGKTLHLADQMRNKGLIWATDRHTGRLSRLKQRLARAEVFNCRIAEWNGGATLPFSTKFDGILVDAPCSGVGTWRRNPHARWTTTPDDVAELASVQLNLLNHAASALKPGGRLIYAVCTTTRSETTSVAERFSASHPELQPFDLLGRGRNMFLPFSEFDANAMFVAGWRRD